MRPQELNLLMIFDAIMTEGAITRAADRLAMTQPAVSNALSRMRTAWGDELFVKDGRGIQPTAFARNLWSQIQTPLGALEDAVNPALFEPATANRTFRIAATDTFVEMVWGPLRQMIEREAPGINIYAIPIQSIETADILKDAEAELAISKYIRPESVIHSEHLLDPRYVVVMRPGHPLAKEALTLEQFIQAEHLLVSLTGDVSGPTDQALQSIGKSRRIAMTVNNFHNVPSLLKQTDLICVAPSMVFEKEIFSQQLAVFEAPVELPRTPLSLLWHKRQDHDAGLRWLRSHIVRIIHERGKQHEALLAQCCRKGYCEDALRSARAQHHDERIEACTGVSVKPVPVGK
ncbi:LysR family transcriptional regulator [Salinimonas sp. HHU 13199]|uniref:LysR family transcriptional regulator n=1 Tax=Salinimonas profundi TaxID=2729140 RepID=A0ABR8LPN0_9ALTE|nr:LysR family transcriptional regulator [Salinimonas profundi]MBD3586085.1 LysR family transcriptional regulator [Salinimonas profundi]